jgi:hypothetical protein
MSEAIGRPSGAALPRPMGIGEILSTAFQLYRRRWRTLLVIAAVVVVPFTLLQHLIGDQVRTRGEEVANGVVVSTSSWAVGIAGLVAALAGVVMFLVLTGAITRAVAAEVAGEDPSLEQSYRFGFHRFWSVLLVGVLVGLATVAGLISAPFGATGWFVQAVVAAVATVVTLPYGVLVGVLLYLDLRARKENLTLERLRTDLQVSAT